MSESDSSMSMNSLMEAIYGTHQSEYCPQFQDCSIDYIPQFMQSLINHLIELCVTQKSADNVERMLNPWIKHSQQNERNPKASIEGFLYEFLKLYDQQTQKINKYGQKKLKYLTNTVSKQIFTQIMRMSCDLKFQSINRMNHVKSMQRKTNNTSIFVFSLDRLFEKDKRQAFRLLKTSFFQGIQREQLFITKVTNSISKIDRLCFQAKKMKLWKTISLWRLRNIEASKQQVSSINNKIKSFFNATLPGVVKAWQSKPLSWVIVIIDNLKQLFESSMGYSEGIEIEFIANPNIQENSLDYSALSSQRSSISSLSCIEIGQFMKNEQIKYDNSKRYLVIPIIADQQIGIVKISWQYQLPLIIFNQIVKIAEAVKLIIKKFAKIGNRIGYYSSEYESNAWHQGLFNLAIKEQPLTIKAFEQILQSAKITFLEIFHDRNLPKSCIKYGRENISSIPDNIYRLIWSKLEKQSQFDLEREKTRTSILKLQDEQGFCRYSFEENEAQNYSEKDNKRSLIIKCIVPLIQKNLGSLGCKSCKINVTEILPQIDQGLVSKSSRKTLINSFNHQLIMKIKDIKSVNELEDCFQRFLTEILPQFHLYSKMLYLVSQTRNLYAYQRKKNNSTLTQLIEIPKVIANENICHIETMSMDKIFSKVVEVMYSNPLFAQPEIYQYENEKKNPFRIFPKRIGRKGLLLVSTFDSLFEMEEIMSIFSAQVDQNSKIFLKVDLYNWASSLFYQNPSGSAIQEKILPQEDIQLQNLYVGTQLPQQLVGVYKNLPNVVRYFTWKFNPKSKTVVNIVGSTRQYQQQVNIFWEKLAKEAVLSHQNIKSSHRILQLSKYYGQKLQSFFTYVPNFSTLTEKIQYAEVVCEKSEDIGEFANVLYSEVSDFLNVTEKLDKDEYQFVSVPIHFENSVYITILIYKKTKHIHSQSFRGLEKYLRRKTIDILNNRKKESQRNSLILLNKNFDCSNPQNLLLRGNKLRIARQIVSKFKSNLSMKKGRNLGMAKILTRINKLMYFRAFRKGFGRIKQFHEDKKVMHENGGKLLLTKVTKIFGLKILLGILRKDDQMKKGLKSLQQCFFRLTLKTSSMRVSKQQFFNILRENKLQKSKQMQLNRRYFFQKIHQIWDQGKRRNSAQFFNKTVYNFYSLKKSLDILQDQFELIGPRNMKNCKQFLISRLNLILKEHYMMPLSVKIASSFHQPQYFPAQFQVEEVVFIANTSFAVTIKSEAATISRSTCFKLIQPVLSKILPKWESAFRKYESIKTIRTVQVLQSIMRKNLNFLFSNHRSEGNKQNIQLFNRLKSSINMEIDKMKQLQQSFNAQKNLQCRQKHKKQMEQLKGEINALQNYQYKVDLETRIKRKTNATYKMINMLNRFTGNELGKQIAESTSKKKDVEGSCEQDKFRYVCEVLPVWISKLSRVLKEKKKQKKKEFFQTLTTLY